MFLVRSDEFTTGTKYWTAVVAVAQLVESRIVIPVVVGSNPISHPTFTQCQSVTRARVAELVDALASGVSVLWT